MLTSSSPTSIALNYLNEVDLFGRLADIPYLCIKIRTKHAIKAIRNILRLLACLVAAFACIMLLLTETPVGQRWLAGFASDQLSELLGTKVRVGKVRIGLPNRLVADDILLTDQQDSLLLSATRLSAKIELKPLMEGKVRINNIQLFGYHAVLKRLSDTEPYNFQFIIDRFKKDDEPSKPLDIDIGNIVIRRGTLEHHVGHLAGTAAPDSSSIVAPSGSRATAVRRFNPKHMKLESLSAKVSSFALTDNSIQLCLNNLSFIERLSGLTLNHLSFQLNANRSEAKLCDLTAALPGTDIKVGQLSARLETDSLADASVFIPELRATITPSALAPFYPPLARLPLASEPIRLNVSGALRNRQLALNQLDLQSDGVQLSSRIWGRLQPTLATRVELDHLSVGEEVLAEVLPLTGKPELEPLTKLGNIQLTGKLEYSPDRTTADLQANTAVGSAHIDGYLLDSDRFDVALATQGLQLSHIIGKDINIGNSDIKAKGSISGRTVQAVIDADNLHWSDQQLQFGHVQADIDYSTSHVLGHAELGTIGYKGTQLDRMVLDGRRAEAGLVYQLQTDFLEAQAEGDIQPTKIVRTMRQMLHHTLPSIFPESRQMAVAETASSGKPESLRFDLHLTDVAPLAKITGADIGISQPIHASGVMDTSTGVIALEAQAPHVSYGSEELTDLSLSAFEQADTLSFVLNGKRQMEFGPLLVKLTASAAADSLRANLQWDNQLKPSTSGEIATTSHFFRDANQRLGADIRFTPSQVLISDTVWNIHPAAVSLHDQKVDVHGFTVSQVGRHLIVDGAVSKSPSDTLYADLLGINLQYVFGLIDFHAVEFSGLATGAVKAHSLMNQPVVDADLRIPDFKLNDGLLGQLHVLGGWGRRSPKTIDLEGHIIEPTHGEETVVQGLVTPGHDVGSGLDLNIFARRVNAYFVNHFTENIFQNLEGTASGYAHLFGPFGQLDLEGDLRLDTAALSLGIIGTRYHLAGDSLLLRPGRIIIPKAYVLDSYATSVPPGQHTHDAGTDVPIPHCGILSGEVRHNHFQIQNYRFDVQARQLLGYDFRDFGDQVFYGTVYASGRVHLDGHPGVLNVDIEGSPTAGTTFTYNASNPDISTDNTFISFVDRRTAASTDSIAGIAVAQPPSDESSDMRINFNLDITPEATMRVLMDARSGDYITLAGNGRIRANYYNKGAFQMYGTYHVDHGTYKLSLQDVIRKDFQIQPGSTLTFGGAPMKGDLDLRAIYSVPSVSLNDLAAGANFSNSTVRVNCIMNIGGRPEQPQVSFDFDIPNVNEDEKQMVRSLIATEEERNLQVIYLLGIGRFYTYGGDEPQNQANSAMNSLLSSTISGQINEYLGRAIGNTQNWNFGTSLSTGNMGWNDMDVEGMLSGRLLNNRLLVNGTFGYRDTPVANSNFIGDFDVQWLLTRSGNISLKAYSETNDRYFTKSALTTQGIGLVLKKDFNNFTELFRRKKIEK